MFRATLFVLLAALAASLGASLATAKEVVIKRTGTFCYEDKNCHNRFHYAIPPVAKADPGDLIVYETRDALDTGFNISNTVADMAGLDLGLVHPLTGPVYINGAKRGDVLVVEIIEVADTGYGFTMIVPGFGFLRDLYTEPYLVRWETNQLEAISPDMPANIAVRRRGFPGTIGVAPGPQETKEIIAREGELAAMGGVAFGPSAGGAWPADVCGKGAKYENECLRTIPPRENGGNMDVKYMVAGTKLLFPCYVDGCLLSIGDVHYAQGNGEVSGTAIEIPSTTTVRASIMKGGMSKIKNVQFKGGDELVALAPTDFHATVGYPFKPKGKNFAQIDWLKLEKLKSLTNLSEDVTLAARHALIQMIEWLQSEKGLSREQAYILCSVAVDLHIAQVVDVPNVSVVAILDLNVFKGE